MDKLLLRLSTLTLWYYSRTPFSPFSSLCSAYWNSPHFISHQLSFLPHSLLLLLILYTVSPNLLLSLLPPLLLLSLSQVATLHTASTSRTFGLDLEPILDILCTASRAQCGAISAEYLKKHKMSLVAAIQKKFSGVAAKALGKIGLNWLSILLFM